MQLYLMDLEKELMYAVDDDFLEAFNYLLPEGENISRWCARYASEFVNDDDIKPFIDLLNPYTLLHDLTKPTGHLDGHSLYFRDEVGNWRYASVQHFQFQFAILKIEKIELNELAASVIAAARSKPPAGRKVKSAKEFQLMEEELKQNPPASVGLVYLKSKEDAELNFGKDLLIEVFGQDNCYMLNNKTVLALVLDRQSQVFQYQIIELYSKINQSDFPDLNIGSHWSNDEDEEIPFILDKAIHKIINS